MYKEDDSHSLKRFISAIEAVCHKHGGVRLNGKIASERTKRLQLEVMRTFARTLHEHGYAIEEPKNLGEKHITAVFDAWVGKGLRPKTLQNQKSRVKQFFRWLHKPQLVKFFEKLNERYMRDGVDVFQVRTVADESKSWRGANVDLEELYRRALREDPRHCAMVMLERAFGLRKKEVLLLKPWKCDKGDHLEILGHTAKNGRPRDIALLPGNYGAMQRRLLDFAKSKVKKTEAMAWPELTLRQAERRYYLRNETIGLTKAVMGMTGHGLRDGFAEDLMLKNKVLPSVLGGTKEMSSREDRRRYKLYTSAALGHNRLVVLGSYVGEDKSLADASSLIGHRFGTPIIGDGLDGAALLWISEAPVPVEGAAGQYCLPGEKADLANITVQTVKGAKETARQNIFQFLKVHPWAFQEVETRMNLLSLTLIAEE